MSQLTKKNTLDENTPEPEENNPAQFTEHPISILRLSSRAKKPLINAKIQTIGQLLEIRNNGELKKIRWLGEKSRLEIENALALLQDETELPSSNRIEFKFVDTRPYLISFEDNATPNLVKLIYPFIKSLFEVIGYDRELDILRRRFGLDGSEIYTLQDIGYYYDLTRERVRQIEARAIKKLRNVLFGEVQLQSWCIQDELIEETKSLQQLLYTKDHLLTEYEIVDEFETRYEVSFSKDDIVYLRLLLEIFGFHPLPKSVTGINRDANPAWIIVGDVNTSKLRTAFGAVYKILQESVAPTTLFDLKVKLNKKRKKKIENEYISYAMKILKEVEQVTDNSFQIKFEYLPSFADKAYRIIFEANEPLHTRDIWREINHRLVKCGLPADANVRSITGQMVADARFEPTGRSGIWSLAEWEHIRRETIVELMIEFFHLKQSSATIDEVYEYVHSRRRDISNQSVFIYIQTKNQFVRVSKNEYELSAWGSKPFKGRRRLSTKETERRTNVELDTIFSQEQSEVMPLGQLVRELMNRTGLSQATVYKRLREAPQIKLEDDPNYDRRKLARYVDNKQSTSTFAKKTKREIVQEEIENYLMQKINGEALVSEVADHIHKTVSSPRTTFYRYLSEMTSVKKKKIDGDLYCFLVNKTPVGRPSFKFPQVEEIRDDDLKKLLKNAIRLLNIEDIDLGLFQLGKIFENEIRAFLNAAREKGGFDITRKDIGRLVDMINCVDRNKFMSKKHLLTLLREQRNERAHGEIPDLKEREKLMQHAPFLVDSYIEYIVYFREKRKEL